MDATESARISAVTVERVPVRQRMRRFVQILYGQRTFFRQLGDPRVVSRTTGEGRSLSQISAYAEAGTERYVLSAILDEHTTDTCRFLDGKVLHTADALRTFDRLERATEPLAIKDVRPWVRERLGEDGKRTLVVDRGGESTLLGVVERSGVGARDDRGAYSRPLSSRDLAPAGIGFPPFRGLCRTRTVADG